jgi:hypothetical protein
MTSDTSELQARMRLLAVEVLTADAPAGLVPDMRDAISLATELLVAGMDSPATVEVASLYPTVSYGEARAALVEMLTQQGVEVDDRSHDPWAVRLDAFARGLFTASDLEGPFYDRLPDLDSQGPLDRRLVVLFDERDHETDQAAKAAIEVRMRAAVRDFPDQHR